jgi:hypothetical protein
VGGDLGIQGEFDPLFPLSAKPAGNSFTRLTTSSKDIFSIAGTGANGLNFEYVHTNTGAFTPNVNNTNYVKLVATLNNSGNVYCASDPYEYNVVSDIQTMIDIANETDPAKREFMISKLVDYYNMNNQLPLAIQYLESLNPESSWFRLIPEYIFSNNLAAAQDIIQSLINSNEQESIDQGLLYNMVLNWKVQNLTPFQMSVTDEELLRVLAEHETTAGEEARRIIELVYQENLIVEQQSDTGNGRLFNPENQDLVFVSNFSIASTGVKNQYALSSSNRSLDDVNKVQLITLEGRLVKEIVLNCNQNCLIDIPELQKSMYLIRLFENNIPIATLKLNN